MRLSVYKEGREKSECVSAALCKQWACHCDCCSSELRREFALSATSSRPICTLALSSHLMPRVPPRRHFAAPYYSPRGRSLPFLPADRQGHPDLTYRRWRERRRWRVGDGTAMGVGQKYERYERTMRCYLPLFPLAKGSPGSNVEIGASDLINTLPPSKQQEGNARPCSIGPLFSWACFNLKGKVFTPRPCVIK